MAQHSAYLRNSQKPLILFPLLLAVLAPNLAQAELSYLDLKGIDALVDHPGASPVYGYTALKTVLENRRFFGNYGSKAAAHGCMDGASAIRDHLVKNHDCPQDFTSEWLQRLFPSQDGVNFVANQVDSDPISHLRPELIGKLLQRIHDVPEGDWKDPQTGQTLEADLMMDLFLDLNPSGYADWIKRQRKELGRLTTERNTAEKKSRSEKCSVEERAILSQQAQELSSKVAMIEAFLGRTSTPVSERVRVSAPTDLDASDVGSENGRNSPGSAASESRTKGVGKEADFRSIAQMLVGALKESRLGTSPKYLPEQALLAFFIQKKANSKTDLIELFKGMPKLIRKDSSAADFLSNPEKQDAFFKDQWKRSDYHPEILQINPAGAAAEFAVHPELLVFSVMEEKLKAKAIPPILSFGSAKHDSLGGGTYPDCGETSLRNFFNIAIYNPKTGKFDAGALTRLSADHPELRISPSLTSFYQIHSDPASASNQAVRDAWSETVVSRHAEVNYIKPSAAPQCEINAGVDNMMSVIDPLLFSGQGKLKIAALRSEKIDLLCQMLSQEGKILSWSVEGAKDESEAKSKLNANNTGIHIQFKINSVPAFSWDFMGGHFSVRDLTGVKDSWKNLVGQELAKNVATSAPGKVPALLTWFGSGNVVDVVASTHSVDPHLREQLIYALPLSNNDGRLEGFRKVVSSPLEQARALKPLVDRIRAKLPEEADHQTKQQIYAALADANNPYEGDTIHALSKPDAVYTRVSPEKLAERYGLNAAKNMGRSWSREMFGRQLIIGEPLLGESGQELQKNFDDAREACISLNPFEQRKAVREALQKREAALDAARKARPNDLEQKIAVIHSANPIPGVYLMSKEQWGVIECDLGYREQKYVPQILPKLKNRFFWSASGRPQSEFGAFLFDGGRGDVGDNGRGNVRSVRCVVGG